MYENRKIDRQKETENFGVILQTYQGHKENHMWRRGNRYLAHMMK